MSDVLWIVQRVSESTAVIPDGILLRCTFKDVIVQDRVIIYYS